MYDIPRSRTRRTATAGTWMSAGAALAAVLVLAGLLVVVLQAQQTGERTDPVAGAADTASPESRDNSSSDSSSDSSGDSSSDSSGDEDSSNDEDSDGSAGGESDASDGSAGEEGDGTGEPDVSLTFRLTLQGAVPFADRFALYYSINGTRYVHGFCGFSAEDLCSSRRHYTLTVPSAPADADLEWQYAWVGGSEFTFGHGSVDGTASMSVHYRCAYLPSEPAAPSCSWAPE